MHYWTAKEIHQISFITLRGWTIEEPFVGHSPGTSRYSPGTSRWTKNGMERLFSLDDAYRWEQDLNDTIPAPPPPEVELVNLLTELCEWYDLARDLSNSPYDPLFEQIAERIGYTFKD